MTRFPHFRDEHFCYLDSQVSFRLTLKPLRFYCQCDQILLDLLVHQLSLNVPWTTCLGNNTFSDFCWIPCLQVFVNDVFIMISVNLFAVGAAIRPCLSFGFCVERFDIACCSTSKVSVSWRFIWHFRIGGEGVCLLWCSIHHSMVQKFYVNFILLIYCILYKHSGFSVH